MEENYTFLGGLSLPPNQRPSKIATKSMSAPPDDLSRLSSLEEDSVRDALRARFDSNHIYTNINALLVALE